MKKQFFLFLSLIIGVNLFAQDTVFFNRAEDKVSCLDSAYRYSVKKNDTVRFYLKNGRMVIESYPKKIKRKKYIALKRWYPNGSLKLEAFYKNESPKYSLTSYWPNGSIRTIESADEYGLIDKKCKAYTQSGADTAFVRNIEIPLFPGGKKLRQNVQYKNKTIRNSSFRDDYVAVKFIVEKDGSVSNVKLHKGIIPELDNEAIRIISNLPKWTPGKSFGKTVPVLVEFNFYTKSSKYKSRNNLYHAIRYYNFLDYED